MATARHDHQAAGLDPDGRLANRATWLTLLCVCSFLLALLAMPLTFQRTEGLSARILASAPLAAGPGTGVLAGAARSQLRVLRRERASAEQVESPGSTAPGAGVPDPSLPDPRGGEEHRAGVHP